jgi:hypothetical protein
MLGSVLFIKLCSAQATGCARAGEVGRWAFPDLDPNGKL